MSVSFTWPQSRHRSLRQFACCCVVATLALLPLTVRAEPDEQHMNLQDVTRGSLLMRSGEAGQYRPAPTLDTQVSIRVTGPIARAVVSQRFENPGDAWAEALYAFPLPDDAAVDHLRMRVDERVIEGEIQPRDAARATYEQARVDGKRAALVEQQRPDLFTTAVANIPPGAEITVEIEYQHAVKWRDDAFSLRFPLAITPRFRPGHDEPERAMAQHSSLRGGWSILPGEIANRVRMSEPERSDVPGPQNPVEIRVHLDSGFPLARLVSPYHAINQTTNGRVREIRLANGPVPADRDFLLSWTPQVGAAPQAAFFTESSDEGHYGLLMLMPPARTFESQVSRPRETIYVIDSSGSMGGASMREAKAALLRALSRLTPGEYFNVIDFDDQARALFRKPMPANTGTRRNAEHFVRRIQAGGGTEMLGALNLAFSQSAGDAQLLRQVVFITDGAIANEKALFAAIEAGLGKTRLFTVGIGSAPNSYFMTRAAEFGRGSYSFIGQADEVDERMDALLRQIAHPALTDVTLTLPVAAEHYPDPLPDLYVGQPISVVMKLDALPDTARVSGRIGRVNWSHDLSMAGGAAQTGLGVLWARSKIRDWMGQLSRGIDEAKVQAAITELALKHHLVSRYTSLVAVDKTPVRADGEPLDSHALESDMPAGWQQVDYANGATPSLLMLVFGLPLTLLGLFSLLCEGLARRIRAAL